MIESTMTKDKLWKSLLQRDVTEDTQCLLKLVYVAVAVVTFSLVYWYGPNRYCGGETIMITAIACW